MKSFRLYRPDDFYRTHGFVSFKAEPDETLAKRVSETLQSRGVEVTFVHGDTECPYPFGTPAANRWIKRKLETMVSQSRFLLSIASQESLHSKWVFHEFFTGTQKCKAVFLLWFDGPDPSSYFFPTPDFIMKRMPSCPVYLIDCRINTENALETVANILLSFKSMKNVLIIRKALTVLGLIILFVAPFLVMFLAIPISPDELERVQQANSVQAIAELWMYVVTLIGIFVLSRNYVIPHPYRKVSFIIKAVTGFSAVRYILVLAALLRIFGIIIGALGGGILIGCIIFLSQVFRKRRVNALYAKVAGQATG